MRYKNWFRILSLTLCAIFFLCSFSVYADQEENNGTVIEYKEQDKLEYAVEDELEYSTNPKDNTEGEIDQLALEGASGDNAYPAKTNGNYNIRAVYKGGSKDGQYDNYLITVSNIDTSVNINTSRTVQASATYNGNAAGSLITEMAHVSTSPHAALYTDLGKTTFSSNVNYIYATFKLNIPLGYKLSDVEYTGQSTRGTLYHLYLDDASLQFNKDNKTWNSATANLLTNLYSNDGESRRLQIRSMVDIFYHAGVGTTNKNYTSGKVIQKMVISPVQFSMQYTNLENTTDGYENGFSETVTYDTPYTVTQNIPHKKGYEFAGWKIGSVIYSSGQLMTAEQVNTLTHKQNDTIAAEAVWSPISYQVAFDLNGGVGSASRQSVSYDTNITFPAKPTKEGYEFLGWQTANVGTLYEPLSTAPASLFSSVQADTVTFKAIWKAANYKIAYYMDAQEGQLPIEIKEYVVDEVAFLREAPEKEGYQFTGWSIEGATYSAKQSVTNLTKEKNATLMAYAKWQPITYSIAYNPNGATLGSTANQDALVYDTSYRLQPNGYKRQFTITYELNGGQLLDPLSEVSALFLGWSKEKEYVNSSEDTAQEEQMILYEDNALVKNLANKSETVTLYAQWDDKPLSIVLQTPTRKDDIHAAKNEQGKDGYLVTSYTFKGWKKKEINEDEEDLADKNNIEKALITNEVQLITENTTYQAVWTEETNFSQNVPKPDTEGEILNKLDDIKSQLSNGYNLTDEQAQKVLEAIENGSAFTLKIDGGQYTIVRNEDGTLSIQVASLSPEMKVVTIPSEVKIGSHVYPITEIYKECFKNNNTVEKVMIGNNIVKIGEAAFSGCKNLKEVELAQGLITIGDRAFEGCTSLTKMKFPSSLQTIGNYAFQNCTALKQISLNQGLLTIGNYSFYKCKSLLKIRIPDTVLKIGKYAFAYCSKCKTISTSKVCTKMGEGVFSSCKALEKVMLKEALTEIPVKAFMGCKKLKLVTIPKKVISIKEKAFGECSALKTVKIKSNFLGKVGKDAFKGCHTNIKFTVPMKKKQIYAKLLKSKY